MRWLTRFLPPFFFAWLTSFTAASLLHSLYVVNGLKKVGATISQVHASKMMMLDWLGLLPTYGVIVAVGLAISYSVVLLIINHFYINQMKLGVLMALAGMCAFAIILLTMKPIMNITLIAGARDYGFYTQLLSGLFGGLVFAFTYKKND